MVFMGPILAVCQVPSKLSLLLKGLPSLLKYKPLFASGFVMVLQWVARIPNEALIPLLMVKMLHDPINNF